MIIRVRGYLTFRDVVGDQHLEAPDAAFTLGDLLARLADDCADPATAGALRSEGSAANRSIAILVNGQHYTHLPDRLNTLLKHGDEIAIFPPLAGG